VWVCSGFNCRGSLIIDNGWPSSSKIEPLKFALTPSCLNVIVAGFSFIMILLKIVENTWVDHTVDAANLIKTGFSVPEILQ
jgi:hypothetical protein